MMASRRTVVEIDRDRLDTAVHYLAGKSLREIAEWFSKNRPYKVNVSHVARDLECVRIIWRERASQLVGERKAEELARLDRVEAEAWDAWDRSKKDSTKKFGERRTPSGGAAVETLGQQTEQRDGNPKFLELVARCVEKRLDILGLAQRRVTLTGPGGGPIKTQAVSEYDDLDDATILELNRVLSAATPASADNTEAAGRN